MSRTAQRGSGQRGPARRRVRSWVGTGFAIALLAGIVGSWVRLGTTTPLVTVATGSMVPTLHVGDIALMESLHGKPPKVGMIVEAPVPIDVQQHLHYPPTVTHRVVEISGVMLTTKGDANQAKDPFQVPLSKVHYRLVRVIPGAGKFVRFLVSPFGMIWLIVGAIVLVGPKLVEAARGDVVPVGLTTADGAVLGELLVAVQEYGEHLRSHTAILQAMSQASQDLSTVVSRLEQQSSAPAVMFPMPAAPTAHRRRPPVTSLRHTSPRPPNRAPSPTRAWPDPGFAALERFVAANGHARVPEGHVEGTFPLGDWLAEVRRAARAGRLCEEWVAELESLGV